MQIVYSPKQTADLLGVSSSAVRTYSKRYADFLSDAATTTPRQFTVADLKTLAFVSQCTQLRSMTHAETLRSLTDGALTDFEWTLPEPQESAPETAQDAHTALVPAAQLEAARFVMADAQRREEEAAAKVEELQQEVKALTLQLGEAQGELEARKRRRPAWLKALIGE